MAGTKRATARELKVLGRFCGELPETEFALAAGPKTMASLIEHGWIERCDDPYAGCRSYRLTPEGQAVVDAA